MPNAGAVEIAARARIKDQYGPEAEIGFGDHFDELLAAHIAEVEPYITALERKGWVLTRWQKMSDEARDGKPILAFNSRHPEHPPVVVIWGLFADSDGDLGWGDAATNGSEALWFNGSYFDYWMPAPHLTAARQSLGGEG